jgi:hypothetical protein
MRVGRVGTNEKPNHVLSRETKKTANQFSGNCRHGKGELKQPNGSCHEGDFQSDQMTGYGVYIEENVEYEGNWLYGFQHGLAKQTYPCCFRG